MIEKFFMGPRRGPIVNKLKRAFKLKSYTRIEVRLTQNATQLEFPKKVVPAVWGQNEFFLKKSGWIIRRKFFGHEIGATASTINF